MKKVLLFSFFASVLVFFGCGDDVSLNDITNSATSITLKINNLPALSDSAKYYAWVYNDNQSGTPVALKNLGPISVKNGTIDTTFNTNLGYIQKAKYFVITIEPAKDSINDPTPGSPILACSFGTNTAALDVSHSLALKTSFSTAKGTYRLYTPTDSTTTKTGGIWFLDSTGKKAGLTLPTIPTSWKFQGWVKVNDKYISTGKFTNTAAEDLENKYCGTKGAKPGFPGEDFISNAPEGFTFPIDLTGKEVMITIEPNAENTDAPFGITVLKGTIGNKVLTPYALDKSNQTMPTGTVTFNTKIY